MRFSEMPDCLPTLPAPRARSLDAVRADVHALVDALDPRTLEGLRLLLLWGQARESWCEDAEDTWPFFGT